MVMSSNFANLKMVRKGDWKLIFGRGSGGFVTKDRSGDFDNKDTYPAQLYDLATDPGETRNLYQEKPAVAAELRELMDRQVREGRSAPGIPQKNDVHVNWTRFMSGNGSAQNEPADSAMILAWGTTLPED